MWGDTGSRSVRLRSFVTLPDSLIVLALLGAPSIYIVAIILLGYLPYRLPRAVCISCGYSLHGLGERGICPECGHKFVGSSGQSLVPPWHRRFERVCLWASPVAIAFTATAICLAMGDAAFAGSAWMPGLAVVPTALLLPFVITRLPRLAVWVFVILGTLPGVALSTAFFVVEREVPDLPAMGLLVGAVLGGIVSSLLSGLVVTVSAAQQHFELARHRREQRFESRSKGRAILERQNSNTPGCSQA